MYIYVYIYMYMITCTHMYVCIQCEGKGDILLFLTGEEEIEEVN